MFTQEPDGRSHGRGQDFLSRVRSREIVNELGKVPARVGGERAGEGAPGRDCARKEQERERNHCEIGESAPEERCHRPVTVRPWIERVKLLGNSPCAGRAVPSALPGEAHDWRRLRAPFRPTTRLLRSPSAMTAIEAQSVWKRFRLRIGGGTLKNEVLGIFRRSRADEFWALQGVNLEVSAGTSLGIVGANGSGKSTLLRLMAGILPPDRGTVRVAGRIAAMIELGAGFHPELTGRENVFLAGTLHGLSRAEISRRFDDIVSFSELASFIDMPVKFYSSGMHARLGFAVSAHVDAEILLVDEVFAVGDAAFQARCLEWLDRFKRQGGTFVLVTHDLQQVAQHCVRCAWLDHGRLVGLDVSEPIVQKYRAAAFAAHPRESADGRRWGDGALQITSVSLRGADRSLRLQSGKAADIELRYRCSGALRDIVLGLAVHRVDGVHVVGVNSETLGQRLPALSGEGRATFHINSLPLTEGEYLLSVSAHDRSGTRVYDHHDRLYPFSVKDPSVRVAYGIASFPGVWRIQADRRITKRSRGVARISGSGAEAAGGTAAPRSG